MTQGLPGSGKTTYAKELVKNEGYKRISKDDLRSMLDNSIYSKDNEKIIIDLRDEIIEILMDEKCNIIIDDCNFNKFHERDIRYIVDVHNHHGIFEPYEFEIKKFNTPLEECILRDSKREKPVGEKAIREMWEKYIKN